LVIIYTALMASADAIAKMVANSYADPELFTISGIIVVILSVLANRHPTQLAWAQDNLPKAMALRSGATVIVAVCFFQSFQPLPFADLFIFIGLMLLLAGLMSGLILREYVRFVAWSALAAGFVGVLCFL